MRQRIANYNSIASYTTCIQHFVMMGLSVPPASPSEFRRDKSEERGQNKTRLNAPQGPPLKWPPSASIAAHKVESTPSSNMAVTACCSTIVAGEILLPKILAARSQKGICPHRARDAVRCSMSQLPQRYPLESTL